MRYEDYPGSSAGKESPCNAGDVGSIPGLGRSPSRGHGNPLQYSCLENPHGQRSLASHRPWGHKQLDVTEQLSTAQWGMKHSITCWNGLFYIIFTRILWDTYYLVYPHFTDEATETQRLSDLLKVIQLMSSQVSCPEPPSSIASAYVPMIDAWQCAGNYYSYFPGPKLPRRSWTLKFKHWVSRRMNIQKSRTSGFSQKKQTKKLSLQIIWSKKFLGSQWEKHSSDWRTQQGGCVGLRPGKGKGEAPGTSGPNIHKAPSLSQSLTSCCFMDSACLTSYSTGTPFHGRQHN